MERYRKNLAGDSHFVIPQVIPEGSTGKVITMERLYGSALRSADSYDQKVRDWLGEHLLDLSLREIAEFRYMQTDPNWTNFLYNDKSHKVSPPFLRFH